MRQSSQYSTASQQLAKIPAQEQGVYSKHMFKASTVYAAYGKRQQQQQPGAADGASASGSASHTADTPQHTRHGLPHLIRASSNSRTTHQASTAGTSAPAAAGFSLEPRTWVQQAADVTDSLLDASKYKSLAVCAEVRLAEALDKAAQACPNSITGAAPEDCDEGQPLPNPLATAVCCQLLGELADLCGPFQPTLLKLREALLPSIYSCCSGPSLAGNRPLQFDLLPWFALAGKLRRQNNQLLEQQAAFSQELSRHQEHMVQVEQQMQSLQAALEAGTASAAALQAANAALVAEHTAAVAAAGAANEEVKRLSEEVCRLAAELDDAHEQLSTVKEEYENEQEHWKGQLDATLLKLNMEAHERTAAVALAAEQQQELEQKLWEVERKLEEAEQQLQQQQQQQASTPDEAAQDQQQQLLQRLTPRPSQSDWGSAAGQLADEWKSTAETVRQLQQQHASQLADCQRQLQLLTALAQPEPCPKPWQLNLRTEACKYFITELEADPTAAAAAAQGLGDAGSGFGGAGVPPKPKVFVAGLGLGPEVPRFLRWDESVEVHDISLQDLEQQVAEVWQAKAAYEAAHGPCCLQTFLHEHLRALAVSSCASPAAAAADGAPQAPAAAAAGAPLEPAAAAAPCADAVDAAEQPPVDTLSFGTAAAGGQGGERDPAARCDTCSIGGSSSSSTTGSQQAVGAAQAAVAGCSDQHSMAGTAAAASAAAAAGYQLYYACCTHRHDSVAVELLWLVLTGQLPEAMLLQQQQQLQAVVTVLHKLKAAAGAAMDALPDATAGQSVGAAAAGQAATNSSSSAAVPWSKLVSSLQALFPGKLPAHQQQLAAWLAAACGLPTASGGSSSSSDVGRPEPQVAASTLAALSSTIQSELFCRFGSSSISASSVGAPDLAAGVQQPVTRDAAPGAGFVVIAAAVRELTEGLLRQHLTLMMTHNQEVGQHVWQQLQQAAPPAAAAAAAAAAAQGLGVGGWPHAEHPVWHQVAQYLQAQGGGGDVLPHLQAAARSESTAGGDAVVQRCLLVPPACRVNVAAALVMAACK